MTTPTPETDPVIAETQDAAIDAADPVDAATSLETEPSVDVDPLDAVTKERDEYLDDLRRARAEFENFRKRMANDSGLQRTRGRNDTIVSLLEFADDLERLVQASVDTDATDLARAIGLLDSKWRSAISGLNVERIDATGVAFDPNEHDAVTQIAAEEPTEVPIVAEVMRVGYRSGNTILRPAMVVVAQ